MDSGVPQGTVLGPILFLIFINDLPSQIKSKCRLFADDCLVYNEIFDLSDSLQLQQDLANLEVWAKTWGMKFNAQKCYILSTEKGGRPYFYQLNGHILKAVPTSSYLGVLFSEDLSFSPHIANTVKKSSRILGFLQRNLKGCPPRLKELAYFTLVRSSLEYSSTVWDPFLQKDIDELERIQRRAARFTQGHYIRPWKMNQPTLRETLTVPWQSLQSRRKNARVTLLYKAVNGLVALPTSDILCKADARTRGGQNNFKHIKTAKRPYSNYFFPLTIQDWNALPTATKSAPSLAAFKAVLED